MNKKIKWEYVFGAVTIGVIIGGTIYAIKKSKDLEKEEEESITLEQARELVRERNSELNKPDTTDDTIKVTVGPSDQDGETLHFDMQEVELTNDDEDFDMDEGMESILYDPEEDDDPYSDEDEDEYDERASLTVEPLNDFNYFEDGIDPKEDKELRHDPNSREAKYQYIRMELADWEPSHPVYRILIQMFEIPFIPTNDGDELLRTQVIDHKVQFFGWDSRWNKEVSFADIIFHYARSAEFNVGESVQYWVEYFLDFQEFEWDSTSERFDTLIMRLNSHTYFNEETETFGLFGLSRESMDQAIRIANMNVDRSVTYEIEFNEFLKSCV